MKKHAFFNTLSGKNKIFHYGEPSSTEECRSIYYKQSLSFQHRYNKEHPHAKIWRHVLYSRTIHFFIGGMDIPVTIDIVRFRYAGTNHTFTFYGSLLVPFLRYSASFVTQSLQDPSCPAALSVVTELLQGWRGQKTTKLPLSDPPQLWDNAVINIPNEEDRL